jgi:hypothetical protein
MRVQYFNKIIHVIRDSREGGWVRGSVDVTNQDIFIRILNFKYDIFEGFKFVIFKISSHFEVQTITYIDSHATPSPSLSGAAMDAL